MACSWTFLGSVYLGGGHHCYNKAAVKTPSRSIYNIILAGPPGFLLDDDPYAVEVLDPGPGSVGIALPL